MGKLIKNGTLVLEDCVVEADLRIEDEVIAEIGENLDAEGCEVIDASGMIILPGGIDVHTHFNIDVGVRSVDDFTTGTIAAAFGGTTTIVDHMGFGPKGCSLHHQFGVYKGYTQGKCVTDYGLHGVFQHVDDAILDETAVMADDGVQSFKMYMTYDYKLDDQDALKIMHRLKDQGSLLTVHCENDAIIGWLRSKFTAEGHKAACYHPQTRPPYCEAEAVTRMAALAKAADAPIYIVHVSTADAAEIIREAQSKNTAVIGETCPQYLVLDERKYDDPKEGLKYIMSPPLRAPHHKEKLWEALKDGTLKTVATDHCSFDFHGDKQRGKDDFTMCPNGAPGVETRMPLMFSEGVSKGRLTLNELAAVTSTNPAKIFGMYPKKGVIAVGSDADLVMFDPQMKVTITKDILHENVDYTAYEGIEVIGWPVRTIIRGTTVVADERLQVPVGFGRFIKRHPVENL